MPRWPDDNGLRCDPIGVPVPTSYTQSQKRWDIGPKLRDFVWIKERLREHEPAVQQVREEPVIK